MATQIDCSSPLPGTMVPIAIAGGSNLPTGGPMVRDAPRCRQAEPKGRQMANHAPSTTKKNAPNTGKKSSPPAAWRSAWPALACLPVPEPPLPTV